MKRTQFLLGFALILIGLALAEGANYLDLRQFETEIHGSAPSDTSGTYQLLKSKNEFSKSFSPEIYADLMRDYSSMDNVFKREFQDIRDSVSKKKSEALRNMIIFLFLASLSLLNYFSLIRKSQSKQTNFAPATT
jgi:hypothetical protein